MRKDVLHYLSPVEFRSIENWVVELEPLVERNPFLKQVDLVIEGGVGNGRTMAHITKALFPNALYVGMDISEMLSLGRYLRREADEEAIKEVVEANQRPSVQMNGAMFMANCFDYDLIRDIMKKQGRRNPLLASYNAFAALVDKRMNIQEKKSEADLIKIDEIVSSDSPFTAQLHINNDSELWEEENRNGLRDNFHALEEAARNNGWKSERFDVGLLLLRE